MKKKLLIMLLSIITLLSGCASNGQNSKLIDEVIKQQEQKEENEIPVKEHIGGVPSSAPVPETNDTFEPDSDEIDVDLTEHSSTFVYARVFNMLSEPDKYVGKTVKMNGIFSPYHSDLTNKTYLACVILDATACCAQGMEFELKENKPMEELPQIGEEITVTGVFDTYLENENDYVFCTIRNAVIEENE